MNLAKARSPAEAIAKVVENRLKVFRERVFREVSYHQNGMLSNSSSEDDSPPQRLKQKCTLPSRRDASSCSSVRHIRNIKAPKYDGRGCVETFLTQFNIAADHNAWRSREKLAQMKCALSDDAAQLICDYVTLWGLRLKNLLVSCVDGLEVSRKISDGTSNPSPQEWRVAGRVVSGHPLLVYKSLSWGKLFTFCRTDRQSASWPRWAIRSWSSASAKGIPKTPTLP